MSDMPQWQRDRLAVLLDALDGIALTEAERRILVWLAGWEPETVEAVACMVRRARQAAAERGALLDAEHRAEPCTKVSPGTRLTCLQSLAEGWITASDLCPRCTRRFMAALESATGADEPLTWHRAYVERAAELDSRENGR